jgi:hypothetical protein
MEAKSHAIRTAGGLLFRMSRPQLAKAVTISLPEV